MDNKQSRDQQIVQVILKKVVGMKLDMSKVNHNDPETYQEARAYNEALDAVIDLLEGPIDFDD
jgi:hypothetical protein